MKIVAGQQRCGEPLLATFSALAHYNQWMNARLYLACSQMSDKLRKQDMGAYFGSIHRTLNHLVYADRAWLARFQGEPPSRQGLDGRLYDSFEQLRSERQDEDVRILSWVGSLSGEWLTGNLRYTSFGDGKTRELPKVLLVTHFFNHQTHHRGQVTTLLSQLGVDIGVTDLPAMPTWPSA